MKDYITYNNLSEEEIQALIINIELMDPIVTPNNNHYSFYPKTVNEAKKYFLDYSCDITYETVNHLKKINYFNTKNKLTDEGYGIAQELRIQRPPIYYWYKKYYSAIQNSRAFSKFNKEVYGADIDQFGFSGINQVNKMIELLELNENTICMDIGCGNGKILEYIHSKTKSSFIGIDYVPEAIESASKRVKNDKLVFKLMQIDDMTFEKSSFYSVMSIDTIFYGRSYNKIFSDINRILKDNGLLVFITSEQNDMEKSLINYFNYEKYDYTEDCFNIMKLKNRIMKKYGKEFERESNSFIWHQYIEESIDESVEVIPKDFSRFIYKATKKL